MGSWSSKPSTNYIFIIKRDIWTFQFKMFVSDPTFDPLLQHSSHTHTHTLPVGLPGTSPVLVSQGNYLLKLPWSPWLYQVAPLVHLVWGSEERNCDFPHSHCRHQKDKSKVIQLDTKNSYQSADFSSNPSCFTTLYLTAILCWSPCHFRDIYKSWFSKEHRPRLCNGVSLLHIYIYIFISALPWSIFFSVQNCNMYR